MDITSTTMSGLYKRASAITAIPASETSTPQDYLSNEHALKSCGDTVIEKIWLNSNFFLGRNVGR